MFGESERISRNYSRGIVFEILLDGEIGRHACRKNDVDWID